MFLNFLQCWGRCVCAAVVDLFSVTGISKEDREKHNRTGIIYCKFVDGRTAGCMPSFKDGRDELRRNKKAEEYICSANCVAFVSFSFAIPRSWRDCNHPRCCLQLSPLVFPIFFFFPSFPSYPTFSLTCDAPQWRRKKLDTQVRLLERVRDSLIGRDKVSQKIPFHHSSSFYYTLAAGGAFS